MISKVQSVVNFIRLQQKEVLFFIFLCLSFSYILCSCVGEAAVLMSIIVHYHRSESQLSEEANVMFTN